ncbi:MAG: hypothetical protein WCB50_06790 [Pseudolabrys sp.]
MRTIKTIPALALVTSLASGALLLAATEGATAKNHSSHSRASELREVHCDHGHDGRHDHDHNSKHKDHDGKGKGKGDNKCGGKKKCPTPIVERIHHPGGGPGPRPGTGPTIGEGLGNIGKLPGGPALGDPGYSAPPAAGSSGGGGAGSPGGPKQGSGRERLRHNAQAELKKRRVGVAFALTRQSHRLRWWNERTGEV